ncbi:DUF1905 domain-containing protein [Nocardioides sp. ChNu-153]|uniref:DUF1905 domain-containing protein n=1 Tax=Nocardioides sp. ChNu-153 TaxID=2779364 RepID=UPI00264FAE8E|nr:DUF1905 domain-containing protein [Nocardioides sp. ChNu-153]MDN7121130.1 DUF1905 domain-containing protein [Nocardioides sp. ChNu-153]
MQPSMLELEVTGEVFWWRGPAPFHFVAVGPEDAEEIRALAAVVTYGWGMIPAVVTLGATTLPTSLFAKDGGYVVPVKVALRRAEGVELGDVVTLGVRIG